MYRCRFLDWTTGVPLRHTAQLLASRPSRLSGFGEQRLTGSPVWLAQIFPSSSSPQGCRVLEVEKTSANRLRYTQFKKYFSNENKG